jgi:hypothetical protein
MVPSTTLSVQYTGNGSLLAFPVSYYFLNATDLVVTTALLGIQVLGVNYTVVMPATDGAGGQVNFLSAPGPGDQVTISRNVLLTQLSQFSQAGGLNPKVIENALDQLTMECQQIQNEVTVLQGLVNNLSNGAIFPNVGFFQSPSGRSGIYVQDVTLNARAYLYEDNGQLKVDGTQPI